MTDNISPIYSAVVAPTPAAEAEAERRGSEMLTPTPAFDVVPTLDLPQPGPAPEMPTWLLLLDADADTDTGQALNALLLATADDEFILGYRNSEWTGIAPMLEEDVAFSSMSQDEIGHARLLYTLLADRIDVSADEIAYGRPPEGFRNSRFLEYPRTDWAFTQVRKYLYDHYDALLLEALAASSYEPLAQVIEKIRREEKYHTMHGEIWLRNLADSNAEALGRVAAALQLAWPLALSLFEPHPGEDLLRQSGILPTGSADLCAAWTAQVRAQLAPLGLDLPADTDPANGGRRGQHSADFTALWEEMTSVYRIDPQASW